MKIEVIEPIGKAKKSIFGSVLEALKACGINGKVEIVSDLATILKYGVKSAPALIVNGMVLFAGHSRSTEEIMKLLQHNISKFT
jgi:predicted thioredoxin/glutaredoxin